MTESTVNVELSLEAQLRHRIDELIVRAETAESELLSMHSKLDTALNLIATAAAMARSMGPRVSDPGSTLEHVTRLMSFASDMAAWVGDQIDVHQIGRNIRSRSRSRSRGRDTRRSRFQ